MIRFYFYHEGHEGREDNSRTNDREAGGLPASRSIPAVLSKLIVRLLLKNGADQRSLPLVCACAHIFLIAVWSSFPREISTSNDQFRVRQPQRVEVLHALRVVRHALCTIYCLCTVCVCLWLKKGGLNGK